VAALRSARPHAVAALLLAALVASFWIHRLYVEHPTRMRLLSSDLVQYFYPTTVFLRDEIHAGRLPTWNPFQMAGFPYLAAQITQVLYPPHLLLAATLPAARALEASALFHLVTTGLFTWLFLRRSGLEAVPSFAGAATFMLSAEMVQRTYNLAYLGTATWLPALFWATHGLLSDGRWRWALAWAVVGALAFLGGNTQGWLYLLQATALYGAVAFWFLTPRERRLRTIALAACAGVLMLSLIAPQLLPTFELTRQGQRGFPGLSEEEAGYGSLKVWTLLLGAIGSAKGTYVTPLAVALIPLGFADRERRWLWVFFFAVAVLVGLFMLGPATPVWRIYYALPLGNMFRIPARLSVVWTFVLSALAALGVQGLVVSCRRLRPRAPAVAAWAGALVTLALVIDSYGRADLPETMPVLWEDEVPPGSIRELLAKSEGMDRIFIDDLNTLSNRRAQSKLGTIHRRFVVPDYEPLIPRPYAELFDEDRLWHGRVNLVRGKAREANDLREMTRVLDLMGVRQYVTPAGPDRLVIRTMIAALGQSPSRRGDMWTANRLRALPRAYTVGSARVEPDSGRARKMILHPNFNPLREAVVSEGEELDGGGASRARPATIRSYSPQEVVIDAACDAPCLLVLNDLHYPGWEATVDGKPAPIVATNLAFRGVLLEPGAHRVVHRFRPKSLWYGFGIAAAGIVAFAAAALAFRRRSRATAPESARARSVAC
jgi:hypothetical protein